MGRTVIINGTALGAELSGIGVYLLGLLTALTRIETGLHFIVYLNKNARCHVDRLRVPSHMTIRWTTRFLSPDYRFFGHALRFLYTNILSLQHRKALCFNGSQLEAMPFRARQVVMIHDIIPLLVPQGNRKQQLYFRYVLPGALRRASAVITPSSTVRDQLKEVYGIPEHKIHVIHHGSDHAFGVGEWPRCQEKGRYILYVGRGDSHKNLERLLRGFRQIAGAIDHTLVLVGVDECRPDGRSQAGGDRILFKGYVSSEEKTALYRNASLLVFPSLQEGFGLPPLEAMLNGCPVVASSASCVPEVCGDAACYVDPTDVASIAEGMYQVATDEGLRTEMIARGLVRARIFSWKTSADIHHRLFLDHVAEGTALQAMGRLEQEEYVG